MTAPASRPHRALRWLGAGLTLACVAAATLLLLPTALGYQRYVIVSGSMSGTYDRGSLVYDAEVPVAALRVGDVITYQPPPGASPERLVTHRIVAIERGADGSKTFRTKGDANATADPWRFTLDKPTQAKVAFGVPYLGYPLAALSIPSVRMLAIGVPAVVVALLLLAGIWREAGVEAQRREVKRWAE